MLSSREPREKALSELPHHQILMILNFHQCKLEKNKNYDLLDFYGTFKRDFTRKLFLMFSSFYPTLLYHLYVLPFKHMVNLDFHEEERWNKNAFPMDSRFLQLCTKVESLERVFFGIEEFELLGKIRTARKLAFEVKEVNDVVVKSLNELKDLKYLTMYSQNPISATVGFSRLTKLIKLVLYKHCLSKEMLMEKSNNYENLRTLEIVGAHTMWGYSLSHGQIEKISRMKMLQNLKLYSCSFPSNFALIFTMLEDLKSLDVSYSVFTQFWFKDVKEIKCADTLEKLLMKNVQDVPLDFFRLVFSWKMKKLKDLDLYNCNLSENVGNLIVDKIGNLKSLKMIKLKRSFHNNMAEDIGKLLDENNLSHDL